MDTFKKTPEEFKDCTSQIIGCAMRVHSFLGNGFQETIYQRALEIEMALEGLVFTREMEMPIFYRNEQIGTRRVDFFVEGEIMVELKAIILLEDVHLAQGINYLEAYNIKTGLLINFGSKSLQFKRLLNKKHNPDNVNRNSSN
ncbi:GxxExxY protein [Mucilaginibacter sp. KACC 22773]|uniref:GxxExxY protein n=1 Tax=Mucilaginibacter sp. KACC 22773 TaxID=3025671 RepID=UPI0023662162|nr:GxxExxY protein [Mucilaginibacter sp. KACC 22773]WDF79201.1 GxxExxY protein [Mucilaginibacter sp. KACC 22773]